MAILVQCPACEGEMEQNPKRRAPTWECKRCTFQFVGSYRKLQVQPVSKAS